MRIAVDSMRRQCQIVVDVDVDNWLPGDNDVPQLPPVVDKLCPSDCSQQGNCSFGKKMKGCCCLDF